MVEPPHGIYFSVHVVQTILISQLPHSYLQVLDKPGIAHLLSAWLECLTAWTFLFISQLLDSCLQVLEKPGRAVGLAVGGAEESLLSRPRTFDLLLKKRQGFVRIALQSGGTILCCAVLCCAVLCCAVLGCAVLCCAVLCCAVLCCAVPTEGQLLLYLSWALQINVSEYPVPANALSHADFACSSLWVLLPLLTI